MISSQYFVGVPFVTAGFLAAMKFVGSLVDPGTAIVIHSLTFTNDPEPAIVQDRTVLAKNALFAGWSAEITANGELECEGGGSWSYSAGHKTPTLPIDAWVGERGCWDKLPVDVSLQACATYRWGDGEHTKACALAFRKVDPNG
ncbi:MAG: hypothetical protein ACPG61_15610 [Paracoccaceae bacterium]